MPLCSAIVSQLSLKCIIGSLVLERQCMASLLISFSISYRSSMQKERTRSHSGDCAQLHHPAGSRVATSHTEELYSITTIDAPG